MKAERNFPKAVITKKGSLWLKQGHVWVYEDEVIRLDEGNENGALTDIVSDSGTYLGTGFLSKKSKIRIRLVSRNANDRFDRSFWKRRIQYAWEYRKSVMRKQLCCCRIIFGEADGFPGLTVDRYDSILVAQNTSFGMEQIKDMIYDLLIEVLTEDAQKIDAIYERNDLSLREKEGLTQEKGWVQLPGRPLPDSPLVSICENGIRYDVDVENGQKTGFFLDQKYNRLAVKELAKGKQVLDCFTHTGSFALNAAAGGAVHVTAVDISEFAIQCAEQNAKNNCLMDVIDFRICDVFSLLTDFSKQGRSEYDFIILDPPAFTKSRKTASSAERGYKEINMKAMKILPRGGYLATASCSHYMPHRQFEIMLKNAARDADVQLRQIACRSQAPDHPILWNVPETDYLKFYLFQVV